MSEAANASPVALTHKPTDACTTRRPTTALTIIALDAGPNFGGVEAPGSKGVGQTKEEGNNNY